MNWKNDPDLKEKLDFLVDALEFSYIKKERVFCFRAVGSKTRAYARTWAFPKIFQLALGVDPVYVIEIIPHNFDKLSEENKTKVLIHELMHIPRSFSGNLRPHKYGEKTIDREVKRLYKMIENDL